MQQSTNPSELLLEGGEVHLFDDDRTRTDSVLFRGERVAAVGDAGAVREEATDPTVVQLDGRTVLPGFNDAHTHLISVGIDELETDLGDADSRANGLARLGENATSTEPGEWVLGFNYDESTWPPDERSLLTRSDLDRVSTEHPIAAKRVDGHAVSVNSLALERIDLTGVEGDVRTDEDGRPTGVLVENAVGRVRRETFPDAAKARRALDLAIQRAHALGITSVQNMSSLTVPTDGGNPVQRAFFSAWRDGDLDLRVTFYGHADHAASLADLSVVRGFGDAFLRIGGTKVFADGSLGAYTAKLSEPYVDDPDTRGQWVNRPDELEAVFRVSAGADQQLATHALGDDAIDAVVDRYEAILPDYNVEDPRPRIEHVELATDGAIQRMADRGIVASMQPNFLKWNDEGGVYETRLGADARATNNRFRAMIDAGVPLAFGSDTMPMGPLFGIHHAVNTPFEAQRLTVDESVAAYTRGAAYAEAAEDWKGSLEPGMIADAVVLDGDPFEQPDRIAEMGIDVTVLGGEIVYRAD